MTTDFTFSLFYGLTSEPLRRPPCGLTEKLYFCPISQALLEQTTDFTFSFLSTTWQTCMPDSAPAGLKMLYQPGAAEPVHSFPCWKEMAISLALAGCHTWPMLGILMLWYPWLNEQHTLWYLWKQAGKLSRGCMHSATWSPASSSLSTASAAC